MTCLKCNNEMEIKGETGTKLISDNSFSLGVRLDKWYSIIYQCPSCKEITIE